LEEVFDDPEGDEDARRLRQFDQDDDPWVTEGASDGTTCKCCHGAPFFEDGKLAQKITLIF
jgi:hypothetical protein